MHLKHANYRIFAMADSLLCPAVALHVNKYHTSKWRPPITAMHPIL
jgi:hypothetical protein